MSLPKIEISSPASQLDNQFQRAHLHGKLVNLVTEIAEGHVIEDAQLKAITSGELTTAEHKHKSPFNFNPFCTCWFGTNHMPHTRDFSDALFRRAIIITFNRVFSEQEQDRKLKDKLKEELPGVLNIALSALGDLFIRGKFTEPDSCIDAKAAWRCEVDQAAQFAEECCRFKPDSFVTSKEIYDAYKTWAYSAGIQRTLNQKNFSSRMTKLGANLGKGGGGVRCLFGVSLVTRVA